MTIETDLLERCQARLKEEGLDAYIEMVDGCPELRVPTLEDPRYSSLSHKAVMAFIHLKLEGQPLKGVRLKPPVEGSDYYDIYCYNPDVQDRDLKAGDVRVWSSYSNNPTFDWTELVDDDAGWSDGWHNIDCEHLDQRTAFLGSLVNLEVIDLPAPVALSIDEVKEKAIAAGARGLYCKSSDPKRFWRLHVVNGGSLVVRTDMEGEEVPGDLLIDNAGRLTLNGSIILTRSTLSM